MDSLVTTDEFVNKELQKFNITDAAIGKIAHEFMPLKIAGLDDKEGHKKVHEARIFVKGKRVEVEKKRKELKEEYLKFSKAVDGEAKRITSLLAPIEEHLEEEESIFEKEKERIRLEAERKEQERLQDRANRLKQYNGSMDIVTLKNMPDDVFEATLEEIKKQYEIDEAWKAEQERLKKVEEERLKKIAEEQAAERKRLDEIAIQQAEKEAERKAEQERKESELRAEREKLEAEKRAIEEAKRKEEAEKRRQAELEQARKEAAEKARIETELKAKREAEEKTEKERLARIEAERQEALRPDKEKLNAFAETISALKLPGVSTDEAITVLVEVKKLLTSIIKLLKEV